ncbi:MAG: hypothetical protein AAGC46_00320 [Solirubrobacteraceae bacterium]
MNTPMPPDAPRPRRGEVWRLRSGDDLAPLTVLITNDGTEEYLDLWFSARVVDGSASEATVDQITLGRDDHDATSLGDLLRVLADVRVLVPSAALGERVGSVTDAGRLRLTRLELRQLPADAYGTAERVRPTTDLATAVAHLVALRRAAIAEAVRSPDGDQEGLEYFHEQHIVGAWPRRVAIARGLVAVVDLVAGDVPPALIVHTPTPGLAAVAEVLAAADATAAHDALRRLVAAEVRVSARPHGLWVLDAAVAADDLLRWIDAYVETLPADAGLRALALRRAEQAAARIARLPYDVLRLAGDHDGRPITVVIGEAMAPLVDRLAAAGLPTEAYATWSGRAVEGVAAAVAQMDRELDEVFSLRTAFAHLGSTDAVADAELPSVVIVDGELLEAEVLTGAPPELTESVATGGLPEGHQRIHVSLAIRDVIADAYDDATGAVIGGALGRPELLGNVWVEALDDAAGDALDLSRLLVSTAGRTLQGVVVAPTDTRCAIQVTLRPTRVVDIERLLARTLATSAHVRPAAAAQLGILGAFLADPDASVPDPTDRRHEFAVADGRRAVALQQALAPGDPAEQQVGGDLPQGVVGTLADRLIAAAMDHRALLRGLEREGHGRSARARRNRETLDDLLA